MKPIEKAFGLTVRKLRTRLGLSQEDFADKAGIHRTYVSAIELGKVQVSISVAMKLATALEVSVAKLWTDVEKTMRSST